MICENCQVEYFVKFGSGRFCSRSCSNGFASKSNNEARKKKIAVSLTKNEIFAVKKCLNCEKEFSVTKKRRNSVYCNGSCRSLHQGKNVSETAREKLRQSALKRHKIKDGIGFVSRDKFYSSYPELLTEQFLTKKKVRFEREVRIGKWFADFKIDNHILEIDGQQHLLPERKLKDAEKDKDFGRAGLSVTRVPWTGNHTEFFLLLESFYNACIAHLVRAHA